MVMYLIKYRRYSLFTKEKLIYVKNCNTYIFSIWYIVSLIHFIFILLILEHYITYCDFQNNFNIKNH